MRLLTAAALGLLAGPALADPPVAGPPPSIAALRVEPIRAVADLTPAELPAAAPDLDVAIRAHDRPHAEGGLTLATEVLLWRTRFGDSAYALRDPLADLVPQGRVRDVQPDARAGLRVGGRYTFEHTGWDVGLTYTHLQTGGGDTTTASPGGLVYPLLTRAGITDRAASASAEASLKYNVFDLEAGKRLALDDHLTLRPFGGVRFADLDTRLAAVYDGRLARRANVVADSTFRGAGPMAGVATEWTLGEHFKLFGATRFGLLYGTLDTCTRETNGAGSILVGDVADRYSGVVPTAAVTLGGGYRWRSLGLSAGYDLTHYFNAISRPDLGDDFAEGRAARRRSDLSLDGVFLRLDYTY